MFQAQGDAASGGHIVILALFAMVVGLSGLLTVPPLDRDEGRFIQATTQMIETGDYVNVRYQDTERNKKPVGIYWLQAASVQLLADVEDRPLWAYRLPSLLGVMLAAVFTYIAGVTLFGRAAAFLGALLLAAAPVLAGEASIAKTDAALLATVCAMQAALARLLVGEVGAVETRRAALYFWIAMGIGVLIKGPIAPFVGGCTAALLFVLGPRLEGTAADGPAAFRTAFLKRLRPFFGVGVLAAIVLPWAVAIGLATEGRFFAEAIGRDMLGKVTTGQEQHGGPPGFHLAVIWFMFWPAALFIPAAVVHAVKNRRVGPVAFALAWIVPTWLLFELTSTKLPHYTMPIYPAIGLLVGYLLTNVPADAYRLSRWLGALLYLVVGVVAAAAVPVIASEYSSDGVILWHYVAAALLLAVTVSASVLSVSGRAMQSLGLAVIASGLFAWVTFEGVLPTLDRLALTPRLADMLDDHEAHPLEDDTGPVALVGYHEPSAVFTLGTKTALLTAEEAADWVGEGEKRAVVIESREFNAFLAALGDRPAPKAIASIEGFNYSNNKDMRLTLYRYERP